MRKIERLRLEALEACRYHGHDMGRFVTYTPCIRYAHCKVCDKQVVIDSYPAPNAIDIGGEAVALDCGSESRFNADGSIKR